MPPLDVRDRALVGGPVRALAPVAVLVSDVDLLVGSVQQDLAGRLRELLPWRVEVEAVGVGHRLEHAVPVLERRRCPRRQRAFVDAEVGVGHDELGVDLETGPQPVACLTCAVRRVEREVPRRELVERQPTVGAGEVLREGLNLFVALVRDNRDRGDALGELQGLLDRVGDPPPDIGLCDQPVDHDLDRVLEVLGQPDRLGELPDLTVDPGARIALAAQLFQKLAVLALATTDDRREDLEPRALGERHDLIDDLLGRLAPDRPAAVVAMRMSDPREQHAQVVVDLGDGADRRPRVA